MQKIVCLFQDKEPVSYAHLPLHSSLCNFKLTVDLISFSDPVSAVPPMANRWLRPEVYPLFAALGVAVGICGMQLVRNICINPEVRVTKEKRAAGVLDNFAEGEKYSEHFLRKYVRNKSPEIMPNINSFFTDPNKA